MSGSPSRAPHLLILQQWPNHLSIALESIESVHALLLIVHLANDVVNLPSMQPGITDLIMFNLNFGDNGAMVFGVRVVKREGSGDHGATAAVRSRRGPRNRGERTVREDAH